MTSNASAVPKIPTITVGLRPFHPFGAALTPADGEKATLSDLLVTFSTQPDGNVRFEYALEGRLDALRLPSASEPAPLPLWEHTCFEAFLATPGAESYREFNFSPDGQWVVAAFSRYRELHRRLEEGSTPLIETSRTADRLTLVVEVPPALLPAGPVLRVGLSAVIEHHDGRLEYRAVRHPAAKPDFHHADGWVLQLDTRVAAQ
ncbi:MAG: DOMON-like domain-containing protein [Azoarcus sp.]|nr:DOMON-like domain-containing protein [Azoarcus sp.]